MQVQGKRPFLRYRKGFTFFILLCLSSCNNSQEMNIAVVKALQTRSENFRSAIVEVECNDFQNSKQRENDKNHTFFGMEIGRALEVYGIKPYGSEGMSDIRVRCLYRYGWGIPSIGRHFDLHFKYITRVNMKLIDIKSDKILAEVEYIRPNLKSNPEGFVKKMVDALVGGKQAGAATTK